MRSPVGGSGWPTPRPGTQCTRDDDLVTVTGGSGRLIRVFLLDDHEVVRRGLRELLEDEPDIEVVGEAESAASALRRIPALRVDVAVLDARLGDGSGIDVCREIRSRDESIKAIILTSYDDDDALFAAIMAGPPVTCSSRSTAPIWSTASGGWRRPVAARPGADRPGAATGPGRVWSAG